MKDEIKKEEVNKVDVREIERYEKIVDRANKEIAGVREVYVWLASVLGIIFIVGMGVATFITYSTIGDIKSSVEERIEEQFDQNNIRQLVEKKAEDRIDIVADTLIGQKINEKIDPLISNVSNQTSNLQNRLVASEKKINTIMADSEKNLKTLEGETKRNLNAIQKIDSLISDVNNQTSNLQTRLVASEKKINTIMADSEKKLKILEAETKRNLNAIQKVDSLISDVNNQTSSLQTRLVASEKKINTIMADSEKKLKALEEETEKNLKAMQIESKFLLTVLHAQNGDKQSWLELGQIAEKEKGTERGEFAVGAFRKIYDSFFKTGFRSSSYYLPIVSDSEVVEHLKDKWTHKRKMAVYTIKKRTMYNQIPTLISMMPIEENLDVLAEINRVLNELLGTDIKITDDKSALRFEEAWENKKKQLEETKEGNN